jgi:hypothetical protein
MASAQHPPRRIEDGIYSDLMQAAQSGPVVETAVETQDRSQTVALHDLVPLLEACPEEQRG